MERLDPPPPIPTPDGHVQPAPAAAPTRVDWQNAPPVVKGWAYTLSWLSIIGCAIFLLVTWFGEDVEVVEKIVMSVLYGGFFALSIWLNRGLRHGKRAAWTVQLVLSCLGLLGFPLGTMINGYILSHWSKPETKAWFGMR
jgi:hypothetical protein